MNPFWPLCSLTTKFNCGQLLERSRTLFLFVKTPVNKHQEGVTRDGPVHGGCLTWNEAERNKTETGKHLEIYFDSESSRLQQWTVAKWTHTHTHTHTKWNVAISKTLNIADKQNANSARETRWPIESTQRNRQCTLRCDHSHDCQRRQLWPRTGVVMGKGRGHYSL